MKAFVSGIQRALCLGLALCLSLALLPFSARAEGGQEVVRVGYFEDNDGFQSGFSDSAPKSGYAYEFYQELAKYTGWKYQYVYGSWSEIYEKLVDGEVDIMDRQLAAEQELLRDKQLYEDASRAARLLIWTYSTDTHRAVMPFSKYWLHKSGACPPPDGQKRHWLVSDH